MTGMYVMFRNHSFSQGGWGTCAGAWLNSSCSADGELCVGQEELESAKKGVSYYARRAQELKDVYVGALRGLNKTQTAVREAEQDMATNRLLLGRCRILTYAHSDGREREVVSVAHRGGGRGRGSNPEIPRGGEGTFTR